MSFYHPYTIFPLGDTALLIDFGNEIDEAVNKKVLRLFQQLKNASISYISDLIPAYSSLTIYYDVAMVYHDKEEEKTAFETMAELVEQLSRRDQNDTTGQNRTIKIPVCYTGAYATDLDYLAKEKKITKEEAIHIHTSKTYRVYMIGFLPGFSYMGQVDPQLAIPRKAEPQNVKAGAVGIAGVQTGIYPLDAPGGWQIIGRTPLKLFDKEKVQPVLLEPGDEIKFYSITEDEFENYQTRRV